MMNESAITIPFMTEYLTEESETRREATETVSALLPVHFYIIGQDGADDDNRSDQGKS